jgi:hypothetical protein
MNGPFASVDLASEFISALRLDCLCFCHVWIPVNTGLPYPIVGTALERAEADVAEAGCSEDFIASISGHREYGEIRTYVQAANKARMATEGMARVLEMFPGERPKSERLP